MMIGKVDKAAHPLKAGRACLTHGSKGCRIGTEAVTIDAKAPDEELVHLAIWRHVIRDNLFHDRDMRLEPQFHRRFEKVVIVLEQLFQSPTRHATGCSEIGQVDFLAMFIEQLFCQHCSPSSLSLPCLRGHHRQFLLMRGNLGRDPRRLNPLGVISLQERARKTRHGVE
jgi:hypothetical protein